MLLLVAGLVVIVLVILVAVFLSVRSMRADEARDDPARSGQGPVAPVRQEYDDYDDYPHDEEEPDRDRPQRRRAPAPAARSAGASRRRRPGALPRPRGHQHDEDPGLGDERADRAATRRRPRQETGSRLTGNGPATSAADWSAGDWGAVSDEQYWAELSADKPLATTARSAQPGRDAAGWDGEAGADASGAGGRSARRDPAPARSQQDPAPTMAAAGASTAQFSLHSGPERSAGQPAGPAEPPRPREPQAFAEPAPPREAAAFAEPWADPMSAGSLATDPSIGTGGWQDAAAGTQDPRTWSEDPLTSPSFSVRSASSADSRSYRGSHIHDRGRPDQPAEVSESAYYDRGHDYQTAPAWGDSYDGHADGWREPRHQYPSGALDPLPQPGGAGAEPADGWYPAPASPEPYRQPSPRSWDRDEAGFRDDPYTESGQRSWPAEDYGADQGPESASSGYHDRTGYDPPGYGSDENGYQSSRYGLPDTGYEQPGRGYGDPGYDDAADADYGRPAHGSSASDFSQEPGYGRYPGYDGGRR